MNYLEFSNLLKKCTKCELHKWRNNVVLGEGKLDSEVMIIGEAPGKNEDLSGRPFVGLAGKLLDRALNEIGVSRNNLYITNLVKCRPPNNRRPKHEEVLSCLPYLKYEVLFVNPKKIILLGSVASKYLYNEHIPPTSEPKPKKISDIRGKQGKLFIEGKTFIVLATYHPAAGLRNRRIRNEFFSDLTSFLT